MVLIVIVEVVIVGAFQEHLLLTPQKVDIAHIEVALDGRFHSGVSLSILLFLLVIYVELVNLEVLIVYISQLTVEPFEQRIIRELKSLLYDYFSIKLRLLTPYCPSFEASTKFVLTVREWFQS